MAPGSIADLLATANASYKVVMIDHGNVTLENAEEQSFTVPKVVVQGAVKVGDEVAVSVRKTSEIARASSMLGRDLLQEMLKND